MPDALRGDGLVLAAAPNTLTIRPASSGRVVFQLQDEQERPVHDYPIDFTILGQALDGGIVNARLSTDRSLTDQDGSAAVQVIIDGLFGGGHSAELFVQASAPGAPAASVYVFVTTDTNSVEIVPMAAPEFVRAVSVDRTQLYFFDDLNCSDVDLASPGSAPIRSRAVKEIPAGGSAVFTGVSGQGAHAVVGLGVDSSNQARVGGCLDLPGSLLLANQTISATLLMDRLLPIPTGVFAVSSDITLPPPPTPQPVAAIQSAWQEWARCPMDPARLLLDCAIDALVTNGTNDPNDCVPVTGGEGQVGGVLDARRGLAISSTSATATTKGATPCRDKVDGSGNVSLDALVDALFADSRVALHNMNLGGLQAEIGAIISSIHLNSTMRITPDREPNKYLVDHDLVDIGFPAATTPLVLKVAALGLPQPAADGVQATFDSGQLKLPPHGFTLRLGAAAQYAFESTSLAKLRNSSGAADLVSAIVAMARFIDRGDVLTGCAALDATVCDQTGNPRGCLAGACRNGLDALARKLTDSFSNLDGNGLDFYLFGSAPAVDLNGDRRADALGIRSSTLSVGTGLWRAEIRSRSGSYSVNGSWAATRTEAAR